jgi:hypothetical protein
MKFPLFTNPTDRRGVLLLLVLSVLTLFLLMGAMLLTLATRARTGARAFAMVTGDLEASSALPRALLDEALMILVRGSADEAGDEAVQGPVTESLLGDMYEESGNKVPFRTEPFDAFGTDPFLTELNDDGTVKTAAFGSGAGVIDVDNDADGTLDGVWLEDVLPEMASSSGGTLSFRVSYLVHDLDARINVNAHGGGGDPLGPASIDASDLPPFGNSGWTFIQQGGQRTGPPAGSGQRRAPRLGQAVNGRGGSGYGLRLDRDAPRPAALTGQANQNPFTPGELERVLRPFDPDCATLPPRLAALLDDLDGSARRQVTTDSWDTTNRKGRVGEQANDVIRRFDLNRPLGNDAAKQSYFRDLYDVVRAAGAPATPKTAQWVANIVEFRDADSDQTTFTIPGGGSVTGVEPDGGNLRWDVGNLVSVAELIGVPADAKATFEQKLTDNLPLFSLLHDNDAVSDAILEAVEVPSPFTATLAQDPRREPGRINVNTCSPPVWQVVAAGGPPGRPGRPYRSMWDLLKKVAGGGLDVRTFNRDLANRLAAVAAVRSNVFAVWITLEVNDSSLDSGSPTCHRLFAIVDRSVPVDYQEGENTDVRKTIRLKRFLN